MSGCGHSQWHSAVSSQLAFAGPLLPPIRLVFPELSRPSPGPPRPDWHDWDCLLQQQADGLGKRCRPIADCDRPDTRNPCWRCRCDQPAPAELSSPNPPTRDLKRRRDPSGGDAVLPPFAPSGPPRAASSDGARGPEPGRAPSALQAFPPGFGRHTGVHTESCGRIGGGGGAWGGSGEAESGCGGDSGGYPDTYASSCSCSEPGAIGGSCGLRRPRSVPAARIPLAAPPLLPDLGSLGNGHMATAGGGLGLLPPRVSTMTPAAEPCLQPSQPLVSVSPTTLGAGAGAHWPPAAAASPQLVPASRVVRPIPRTPGEAAAQLVAAAAVVDSDRS